MGAMGLHAEGVWTHASLGFPLLPPSQKAYVALDVNLALMNRICI